MWKITYARKRYNFRKLCVEMLFRFESQIEKLWSPGKTLGPGFFQYSTLIKYDQIDFVYYVDVNRTQI